MKRGIVMSVHAKHAVVMTAEGQFLRAPLQGSPQIGEEILFEEEQSEPRRKIRNRISTRYAAVAAMLGIMLIAGLAYAFSATHPVVAYLTMDINPSVEIGIDGDEKVRKLRALNGDGQRIIAGIAYKGVDVETVAAAILEQAGNAHYLDAPHKDILITSVLLNGKKQPGMEFESLLTSKLDERLQQWLAENAAAYQSVTITTLSVPEALRVEADANGISSGKMAMYLMAKGEGYQVELSQLKEKSIDSWSEPIGGVKSIVDTKDEAATKMKLEELLAKEKKEQKQKEQEKKQTEQKQQKQSGSTGGKESKPAPTATPSPSPKSAAKPTGKPSVKPSETGKPNRHGWWHSKDDDDDDHKRSSFSKWNNGRYADKQKGNSWYDDKNIGWYKPSDKDSKNSKNNKDSRSNKDNKNNKDNKDSKNNKDTKNNVKNNQSQTGNKDSKGSKRENGKNSSKKNGNMNNDRDKDSFKKGNRDGDDDDDEDDDRNDRNRGKAERDRDKGRNRGDR